jgi:hypothetical protein
LPLLALQTPGAAAAALVVVAFQQIPLAVLAGLVLCLSVFQLQIIPQHIREPPLS